MPNYNMIIIVFKDYPCCFEIRNCLRLISKIFSHFLYQTCATVLYISVHNQTYILMLSLHIEISRTNCVYILFLYLDRSECYNLLSRPRLLNSSVHHNTDHHMICFCSVFHYHRSVNTLSSLTNRTTHHQLHYKTLSLSYRYV